MARKTMTEPSEKEWLQLDHAVTEIMKRTGKNRRQAKADLMEKIRTGQLPLLAFNPETGEEIVVDPNDIPPIH